MLVKIWKIPMLNRKYEFTYAIEGSFKRTIESMSEEDAQSIVMYHAELGNYIETNF